MLATLAKGSKDLVDARFAVRAVEEHIELFGKAPKAYAYDRGGWSAANLAALKKLKVKAVGLAPRGKSKWKVSARMKMKLISERAQIEGGIGTIKHAKYGFNRPAARSARMMGTCGQLAVLGFNMNKVVRVGEAREASAGRLMAGAETPPAPPVSAPPRSARGAALAGDFVPQFPDNL